MSIFGPRGDPRPNGIATQDWLDRRMGPRIPHKPGGVSRSTGSQEVANLCKRFREQQWERVSPWARHNARNRSNPGFRPVYMDNPDLYKERK